MAIEPFLIPGVKLLWDMVKSTGEKIKDFATAAQAYRNYAQKYKSRYGWLKLLGMLKPVTLDSVYTAVRFLDKLSILQYESLGNIEEIYRESPNRRFEQGERRNEDGIQVATSHQYLMVLGGPGSGKTTYLRKIGLEALKEQNNPFKPACLPVLLELKRFRSDDVNLIQAIAEELEVLGFPASDKIATNALKQGKLLILLDGLDEVPQDNYNAVSDAIDKLVTQYENNRFIASCRIAAQRSSLRNFTNIQLADFDDEQIEEFIEHWFSSERERETATECWQNLQEPNNAAAKELAHTPLLLTFLCIVYKRKYKFPPQRSELYRAALDIILEEWAAHKRLKQEPIYPQWNTALEKELLAHIAYDNFSQNQVFFPEQELVDYIKDFLADTVDNPKYLDGKAVLKAIALQQGILVERPTPVAPSWEGVGGGFSFSHLTFQEYLTALYISKSSRRIQQLVVEHLEDKRWREVFLLVAGLTNAEELLELMEQKAGKMIHSPKLRALLQWADNATAGAGGDISPTEKRAIALAFANTNAYANAYANPFANLYALAFAPNPFDNAFANTYPFTYRLTNAFVFADADTLDEFINSAHQLKQFQVFAQVNFPQLLENLEMFKAKIPQYNSSQEVQTAFFEKVIETWLNSFHLTLEMVTLSKKELKEWRNYSYVNLLIVKCKEAAARVSQKSWSKIEERMLRLQ